VTRFPHHPLESSAVKYYTLWHPANHIDFSSRLTWSFSVSKFFFLRKVSQRRKIFQKEKLGVSLNRRSTRPRSRFQPSTQGAMHLIYQSGMALISYAGICTVHGGFLLLYNPVALELAGHLFHFKKGRLQPDCNPGLVSEDNAA